MGGSVIEFRIARGVTPNFHQGTVRYADRTLAVICDREQALFAVAEPREVDDVDGGADAAPLTFVDAPEPTAAPAEQSAVQIVTAADLVRPSIPLTGQLHPQMTSCTGSRLPSVKRSSTTGIAHRRPLRAVHPTEDRGAAGQ
jgi:hypothetical protein